MFYLFAPKVKDGKPLVEIPKKGDFYRDDIGCPVKMMDYECRVYMPILEMKTFEQDPFRYIRSAIKLIQTNGKARSMREHNYNAIVLALTQTIKEVGE